MSLTVLGGTPLIYKEIMSPWMYESVIYFHPDAHNRGTCVIIEISIVKCFIYGLNYEY